MRIWILNHYASPPDRPAGTRHYELGRILAARGHDVTIFASSFSHYSMREERLTRRQSMRTEYVGGVRFIWLRTTRYQRNDYRRALNMLSYSLHVLGVQQRLARPDVVVGSSVHLGAVLAAWIITRLRKTNFVFEVRDLWPQALIDMGELHPWSGTARVLRFLEVFLYHRARVIISLLPGATDYISKASIPQEKIVYIPNGFDDSSSSAHVSNSDLSRLLGRIDSWRQQGCLVAGYTGSHGIANGVHVLIEAARVLQERGIGNIGFALIGDGPAKPECERLARKHELANILFSRPVPKECMQQVLSSLDVALFPLRDASVGRYGLSSNKLFDYLASGRPIVSCCGVPGNPVEKSGAGICVPAESPEAVADALQQLASLDAGARAAIGERGRQWVYQHHAMTALADRFLDALTLARR